MENLEHLPIQFPDLRANLMEYVYGLSDYQYQQDFWGKTLAENYDFYDDFDQAIHFLYDTLDLTNQPEEWLNLIFLNQTEVQFTKNLVIALEKLFGKYGLNLADSAYQQKPEWEEVLSSAKILHQILLNNNQTKFN